MKYLAMGIAATMLATTPVMAGHHDSEHKTDVKAMSAKDLRAKSAVDYYASEGIGRDVYNSDMTVIATVDDMGITNDGKVAYVILDVSGLENMMEDKVAVPHNAFMWNESEDKLILNMTQEALAKIGK